MQNNQPIDGAGQKSGRRRGGHNHKRGNRPARVSANMQLRDTVAAPKSGASSSRVGFGDANRLARFGAEIEPQDPFAAPTSGIMSPQTGSGSGSRKSQGYTDWDSNIAASNPSAPSNSDPLASSSSQRFKSPDVELAALQRKAQKLREKIAEKERVRDAQRNRKGAGKGRKKEESDKRRSKEIALPTRIDRRSAGSRSDIHSVPKKESGSKPQNTGRTSIENAVELVGTCMTMCPENEMNDREIQNALSVFELLPGSSYRADPKRSVKKYRRSAALSEQPKPGEVRPSPVLAITMDHLKAICDCTYEPFYLVHSFVRDRTRSIRQDFTFQGIRDDTYVRTLEECVRFHILSEYRLFDAPLKYFSSQQNLEQLDKCLISLRQIYDERRENGESSFENEAEMQSYYLLSHILHSGTRAQRAQAYSGLTRNIFQSEEVKFACVVSELVSSSLVNYVGFFKTVAAAPYLFACMLHKHFGKVRDKAVKIMAKAYSCGGTNSRTVFVSELKEWLGFDSAEEVIDFCGHYRWPVSFNEADGDCEDLGARLITVRKVSDISTMSWKKGQRLIESKCADFQPSSIISGNSHRFYNYSWMREPAELDVIAQVHDSGSDKEGLRSRIEANENATAEMREKPKPPIVSSLTKLESQPTRFESAEHEKSMTFSQPSLKPQESVISPMHTSKQPSTSDTFALVQPLPVSDHPLKFQLTKAAIFPVEKVANEANVRALQKDVKQLNVKDVLSTALETHVKPSDPVAPSKAVSGNVVSQQTSIMNERESAKERKRKLDEEELRIEKDQDAKAMQQLKALEEEFTKISTTPSSSLALVEKELKFLAMQKETPQRTLSKLTELAMIVQSTSRCLSMLESKAKSTEPVFADTEEKKEWILLDCEDYIEFAGELWNELWDQRLAAKHILLKRGGCIGTYIDRSRIDETRARNKKRGYGEDGPFKRPSNKKARLLPLSDSQHEIRRRSIQKLLAYMKKRKILRFKVNILKHGRGRSDSIGSAYRFCKEMLAPSGGDENLPRLYYENGSPSYHEPVVVMQSSEPGSDELNTTNVLVVGLDALSMDGTLDGAISAIQCATAKIRSGKYHAPFLIVVHNEPSYEEMNGNTEAFRRNALQVNLALDIFVTNGDIRGFKTVFTSFPKSENLNEFAKTAMVSFFKEFESIAVSEVEFMVYQDLRTSSCKAGDVALQAANVVSVKAMENHRGGVLRANFVDAVREINAAWGTLIGEIYREQDLWPSEHRVAQSRLRNVAQRMQERLQLPHPPNIYTKTPGEYLLALSRNVYPGSLVHMALGRVSRYPDFVASLTRLLLPFVKMQMGDCFDTILELPPSIAFPSTGEQVLRHIIDVEPSEFARALSVPDPAPGSGKKYRSRDDSVSLEPPLKRSRPHDSTTRELELSPSRFVDRRAGESSLLDKEHKAEMRKGRKTSLQANVSLTHAREDNELLGQLYELEQCHGRAIDRAIAYVEAKIDSLE